MFIAKASPDGRDSPHPIDKDRGFWWFNMQRKKRAELGAGEALELLIADYHTVRGLRFTYAPDGDGSDEMVTHGDWFPFLPGAYVAFDLEVSEVNGGCTTRRVLIERPENGDPPTLQLLGGES